MKFPDIGGGTGGKNAGLFVKLKDGESLKGVFRGDPHVFRQHWADGRSSLCVGKDSCEKCAGGDKPKFRFHLNLIVKEDGIWVAKIFNGNYGTFKDLKEMHESSYDLPETLVRISRTGEKQNTRFTILPVKNNDGLKPVDFQKIEKIPLNELSDKASEEAADDEREPGEEA